MSEQRPIGFWLKLVDRLIDEQFAGTLDEHGVTRRQWQLMSVLARNPANVAELDAAVAPFLETGGESSAEHLTELIESGWVDATSEAYELTDRGRLAFDRLGEVVAANRATITDGVPQSDYDATVAVLERMARNLGHTA